MGPDKLYPNPDPQNLMNTDPDPGQKYYQVDNKHLLIFKIKIYFKY